MSREINMFRNRVILKIAVRRLVGLGVLLGICAVVVPFPVMMDVASIKDDEKDLSQPFPCMNRPCGCRSADECWKKCCCFTNVQKVAWAKANRVPVPQFVIVAAEKESSSDKCCCGTKSKKAAVSRPTPAASAETGSCCHKHKPAGQTISSVKAESSAACCPTGTAGRTKWVLALKAAECQGQSVFWLTLPPTIIPTWLEFPREPPTIVDSRQIVSERLPVMSLQPPWPPPKIG